MHISDPKLLISSVLRGEDVSWPSSPADGFEDAFIFQARYHGATALLYERLSRREKWPQSVLDAIRRQALSQTMWELRHKQVLTELIEELTKFDVQPLIFKGTALAYDLYSNPVLRSRGDTDIIIASRDLARCRDILLSQGFRREFAIPGEFVSYEESWTLIGSDSVRNTIDLHRKINNSELLSRLFTYDELRALAVSLPALCPQALAACRVHALLLACMHRAAHMHTPYYTDGVAYYGGDRLIWLYDIHLLAATLTSEEWADVVRLALKKGLCGTCLDGLECARVNLGTQVPEFALTSLVEVGQAELPTTYLNASNLRQQWMDYCAHSGFWRKTTFLKELIFPSADYMRRKYPDSHARLLPYLYTRRAVSGVTKRLARYRHEP